MADLLDVTQDAKKALLELIEKDERGRTHVRVFVEGFG